MDETAEQIKKPSLLLLAAELPRALMELASFIISKPILRKKLKGDGHPVLLLPGFMSGDKSTKPLRTFLNEIGYTTYPWELGLNFGSPHFIDILIEQLEQIYQQEQQPLSLVGWSLGGVYAREIARRCPAAVRQVITLGSPFAGLNKPNNVSWLYSLVSGKMVEDIEEPLLADMLQPPPVPTTAIYSKGDGIVAWQHCMEQQESHLVQNIQVKGSHCGLGVNPAVILCVANRLAQPFSHWQPFRPRWYEQFLYPNLVTFYR